MFELHFPAPDAVELYGNGRLLFHHSGGSPALFLGKGRETIHMFRGNFDISDRISERYALQFTGTEENGEEKILPHSLPRLKSPQLFHSHAERRHIRCAPAL